MMDLLTLKLEGFTDYTEFNEQTTNNNDGNKNVLAANISTQSPDATNPTSQTSKMYKKKRQKCTLCPVHYSKREYLSKHMSDAHNITLEKKRPGRQSRFIRIENDPRPYKCDECVKEYVKSKHLARHKRTHLETKICDICGESFANYADHMLKKHGIDLPRPFECDICKKTYRTKSNVQSHMRLHRAASREFRCTVCPKSFCFGTDLRKHMKTHSQSRSIICDICGDAFKSADTLKCHMRRHTGERPYKCSQCPRAFSTSNSLDIHVRTHTGEKPFQCEFCEKRFSDSSTLLVHKRLHTNENPYMCHLCGRRTKQASNLRSHYKHYHRNNDISGRQIRQNSRILSRFTQSQIDAELVEFGDLMALLERGFQEFDREENEKNNQIEMALESMKRPIALPTIPENDNEQLVVTVKQEYSLNESESNAQNCDVAEEALDRKPKQTKTKQCHKTTKALAKSARKNVRAKTTDDSQFQDVDDSNVAFLAKSPIHIESVFIEDIQSPMDGYAIDIKKEGGSDEDNWPMDNYNETPTQSTVKCEASDNLFDTPNDSVIIELVSNQDIEENPNNKHLQPSRSRSVSSVPETKPKIKKLSPAKVEMERCEPCNRRFHDMVKHWVENHSGIERPYECYICRRDYKRFEHLKNHFKTHGDERNFICHVCGDSFFLSNELRKHIMNRHQVERPYSCNFQQCEKAFKDQHALNVHMRTHSGIKPYVCKVCGEAFSAMSSLKIHERKHTGDKPYVCKFCNKAFADCSTHRQHERIHTGEKPYRCHLCDRRTAQAGNLKSHYRHYHKIIVKKVSMFVDNSTVAFADEFPRHHEVPQYPLMYPSRRNEE